jgi:transcription initiation factor TFIIA small subunit
MYEFYRQSVVGKALVETIDERVSSNALTPTQAKFILEKFDLSIPVVFSRSVTSSITFKGKISSYNFVDGVWKFLASDFSISSNNHNHNRPFVSDFIKIVACDADTSVDVGKKRRKKA